MALFTDGPISCIEDLAAQDSQLLNMASVEGIDVTQKIAIAYEELAMELYTALNRFGYLNQLFWLAPQPKLDRVVVTPPLQVVAYGALAGTGLQRCIQQSIERPVCGEAGPVSCAGAIGI